MMSSTQADCATSSIRRDGNSSSTHLEPVWPVGWLRPENYDARQPPPKTTGSGNVGL